MPHLSYEYSENITASIDHGELCATLHRAALDSGLFELGGLRVRAHRSDVWAIADLHRKNSFLHLTISIGAGRSAQSKQKAGAYIWEQLTDYLASVLEAPHFALSMEIREIDPDFSWKMNTIHPRLRADKT